MVCVYCGQSTRVINSRHQKKTNQVWRRRQCTVCEAVFTTLESVDAALALRVHSSKGYEAFSRDKLLMSVYDSLRHRKSATDDATALARTIVGRLYGLVEDATLERDSIVEVTATALGRFDAAAATSYRAFHPV